MQLLQEQLLRYTQQLSDLFDSFHLYYQSGHMLLCVCLTVTPHTQCRLKLLKQERIKDYLLMEEEFIRNQEQMKPLEEKQEVRLCYRNFVPLAIYAANLDKV